MPVGLTLKLMMDGAEMAILYMGVTSMSQNTQVSDSYLEWKMFY